MMDTMNSTFQTLMNDIFRAYLHRIVLLLFADILIYSLTWLDHLEHLRLVFSLLRNHSLFLKSSKCTFGTEQVEYLGYIISATGVATDSNKIATVQNWPSPSMSRALRGFLGLIRYY